MAAKVVQDGADTPSSPASTPMTFWELVIYRAERTPDAVLAVDEGERVITFAEFRDRTERVAAGLQALGVGANTVASWQLPTWIESFILVGAMARLGALQNPLLPIYRERELRFILRQARPRLLVVPSHWRGFDYAELAHRLTSELSEQDALECSVVVCDRVLPDGNPRVLGPAPRDDAAIRWLFYTSGTTAEPKGALHSDASIAAGARAMSENFELSEDDRYPVVFPFTHVGGIGMLFAQLFSGCSAFLVEQFDPQRTPQLIGRHGATILAGGTALSQSYLHAQRSQSDVPLFPRVRAVLTGAAPKPASLHSELKRELGGLGAVSVYGSTEFPITTASTVHDSDELLAFTEGRLIPGAEVRVKGDDGSICKPGEIGELTVRGPHVCHGYLDPLLNKDAIDEDGFFYTGDLGKVDEEGYVTITGRVKDIIIRKGENISTKEVEDVLYEHPDVAEVAVVGLDHPDVGEQCFAVIVLREGAPELALVDVLAHCRRAGMAKQKIPERIEIVAELPRNASGKVLKTELRNRFEAPGS